MEETFDLFDFDLNVDKPKPQDKPTEDLSVVCEAVQIIKIVKSVMTTRREIVDTIKIDGAKMTYERAIKIAKAKAKAIGNCMVVEKLEKIVVVY